MFKWLLSIPADIFVAIATAVTQLFRLVLKDGQLELPTASTKIPWPWQTRRPTDGLESTKSPRGDDKDRPAGQTRGGRAREFLFRLQGDKADGALVQAATTFDLVFEYSAPSETDLVNMKARLLDDAVARELDVEISIAPGRLTVVDGIHLKVARFRNGQLTNDVIFKLRAEAATDNAGLHVFVSVEGRRCYDFPLPIQVVADLGAARAIEAHTVRRLDLDALARVKAASTQRDIRITFEKSGEGIKVSLLEGGTQELKGLPLAHLSTAMWATLLKNAAAQVKSIAEMSFWNRLDSPLEAPEDPDVEAVQLNARNRLIAIGWELYRDLAKDANLAFIFNRIEEYPPDSRISVWSNCGFLPFEILYPEEYHDSYSDQPTASKLWGYRFRIEYQLWEDGVTHDASMPAIARGNPLATLNVDPEIDRQITKPPQPTPPFLPVGAHDALLTGELSKAWRVEINRDAAEVLKTLQTDHDATLLYYYCHGRADAPMSLNGDGMPLLMFGTKPYDPNFIQVGRRFRRAPLVVLNSCSSAEAGPLSFLTFLERFRRKGAIGVVSTWFNVPMLFASAFGREMIAAYATGQPLGDILYDLRRRLLDQNNPLGLFYALQCPMDHKAPAATADEAA